MRRFKHQIKYFTLDNDLHITNVFASRIFGMARVFAGIAEAKLPNVKSALGIDKTDRKTLNNKMI